MMLCMWQGVLVVSLFGWLPQIKSELLQNGDFESGPMTPWHCFGIHCELMDPADSRLGSHAIKASGRTQTYQGPGQDISPVAGKLYRFSSYMKVLNDKPDMLGQTLDLMVSFTFSDDTKTWINVAHKPQVTVADGWVYVEGDFQIPAGFQSARAYYQGPDLSVAFAVDNASMEEITADSQWRTETDANIDRYRKSDINVHVHTSAGVNPEQVQVRVVQTKKSFPFGTAVNVGHYMNSSEQKYRDFIHTHFNWATLENALKWKQLERTQGHYNYQRALHAIQGLHDHGLKVRGHNLMWAIAQYTPTWVTQLSGEQLKAAVQHHINWTLGITHGLLEHWDVYNENLHGQWYEDKLMDRDYDLDMYRMAYAADPVPKLFLNDFGVVGLGAATAAYKEQGLRFKNANVHLYGMGLQSHFQHNIEPNPTLIKQRLDMLATVGVPLWTTELDVSNVDENVRADWYEQALRALYGHPAIEGIIFWGFWGDIQSAGQEAALVTGPNLQLTAAGHRVLDLLENQWMTDLTHDGNDFTVRGFHGDYEVYVLVNGQERTDLKSTFTLGTDPKTVNVNVHP